MNIDRINVGGNLYDVCDTNARAMISDEYNSATQYNAGDYCIWENTLKKANKSTTGTYDHTAWDDTNIGEVVGELNQNMSAKFIILSGSKTFESLAVLPDYTNVAATELITVPEGYTIISVLYNVGGPKYNRASALPRGTGLAVKVTESGEVTVTGTFLLMKTS